MRINEWIFKNNEFSKHSFDQDDSLNPGEVLLKPLLVGVCGSDLFALEVADSSSVLHLGHEWVGEVLDSKSEYFSIGDKVTSPAFLGCGKCEICLSGKTNLCPHGKVLGGTQVGALRNRLVLNDINLVKLNNISLEASVLIEVAAVGYNAISHIKKLGYEQKKNLLIFGAGPVGLFCALQA